MLYKFIHSNMIYLNAEIFYLDNSQTLFGAVKFEQHANTCYISSTNFNFAFK
jgi:hypothetical protein